MTRFTSIRLGNTSQPGPGTLSLFSARDQLGSSEKITPFFILPTMGPVKIPMLVALLPVTLWIVIFFTWRFVSVEHEYVVSSGVMTFTDVLGGRTRRVLFAVSVKDMTEIAPVPVGDCDPVGVKSVVDLRGTKASPAGYCFKVQSEEGETFAVLFTATEKALKILRYYNPIAFKEA